MIYLLLAFLITSVEAKTSFTCEGTYDHMEIPHVKTSSTEEFYYCFGLYHGKDRAWLMDYFRRAGQGRNAEVLGFSQLKSDLMMRLLNLEPLAEKLWGQFPKDKKRFIELYTEGANEGLQAGKKAKEFLDLGYEPEPWKPHHTVLVLLLQSFDQTKKTFFKDYEEEKFKQKWGAAATTLFDDDHMPWSDTILKEGEYVKRLPNKTTFKSPEFNSFNGKLWANFPSFFGEESGSNNWVVSREKSKTKNALLANDPHLDLKTPLFWYWINLKSPELSVMGASVPGVPFIASGTNGKVSWGLTNSYLNSADALFVNDLKKEDIETIRPTVLIKFWFFKIPFFFKSFEKLKTGHPVLPLELETSNKVVLKWIGYSLDANDVASMLDVTTSKDVMEMDRALAKVGLPSWNFVFADTKGDIGYRAIGKTFRHTEKLPYGIYEVTKEELNRIETLSENERPQLLKPKRNYVLTANHRTWPEDAKFYGGRGYSHSFRAFRMNEMIQGTQDVENFKKIQCDRQVVDARFFLPKIQKLLKVPQFENWSMLAEDSSTILPLYRRFFDLLMEKWEVNEYSLIKMLDDISPKQLNEMKDLLKVAEKDVKGKNWGDIHRLIFPHISKNDDWVFSPEIAGNGDTHSVDPGTSKWNPDRKIYEQQSGASMRMIIEMKKTPQIFLVLPGLNRNYDQKPVGSPWEDWKNCKYSEVSF
jgi:penicillin amidase